MKIDYAYDGFKGKVFLSLLRKKVFFVSNKEDRKELHSIYGGKYHSKGKTGQRGSGYFFLNNEELITLPRYTVAKRQLNHVPRFRVLESTNIELIVGLKGLNYSPAVAVIDKQLYFMENAEEIVELIKGNITVLTKHCASYKYLTSSLQQKTFTIAWYGNSCKTYGEGPGSKPDKLPCPFEDYVRALVGFEIPDMLDKNLITQGSFIERRVNVARVGDTLIRTGFFGLPKELVGADTIFPTHRPMFHKNKWTTRGFPFGNFGFKTIGESGETVYMVVEKDGKHRDMNIPTVEFYQRSIEKWAEILSNPLVV